MEVNNAIPYMSRVALFVLSIAVLWLGYLANRSDFWSLLPVYSLSFGAYFVFLWLPKRPALVWVIATGIVLRFLLLFGLPLLSDDVYRFIWDGRLAVQGIHPFAFTPVEIMQQGRGDAALYDLLNSPRYFTVYPPVNQAIFWLSARWNPDSVVRSVFIIKSFLFLGELGTMWAVYRLLKKVYPQELYRGVSMYVLNPLVIVEVMGNCHFEGMMAGALIFALLALHNRRPAIAGVWWSVAIAVKLLPILFFPLVLGWLSSARERIRFTMAAAVAGLALFIPLFDLEVMRHLAGSVKLYFQQFEFNASVYYVFSHISPFFTGWYEGRTMSVVLAEVTVACVLGFTWRLYYNEKKDITDLHTALFWVSAIYLIDATTVHPWYLVMPLVLCIGTRWWYPAIWTWAVVLSYSHYHHGAYLENYWLIGVEYTIVAAVIYWNWTQPNLKTHQ